MPLGHKCYRVDHFFYVLNIAVTKSNHCSRKLYIVQRGLSDRKSINLQESYYEEDGEDNQQEKQTQQINWDNSKRKADSNYRSIWMIEVTEKIESGVHDLEEDISETIKQSTMDSQKPHSADIAICLMKLGLKFLRKKELEKLHNGEEIQKAGELPS